MTTIKCQTYTIHFGNAGKSLATFLQQKEYTSIFILVDSNTQEHCLPLITEHIDDLPYHIISIQQGEVNKNIETCQHIWDTLVAGKADRKSLLINLGGGVIGDMGGFCASTYMRGMDFIQVPTTLLSMVDASVGAKLGIDYDGYKNLIGLFNQPVAICIDTTFLSTLPHRELSSGFAEILKHALIQDQEMWTELEDINLSTYDEWDHLIKRNVEIKKRIVENDPTERGARKALNFGHTIGHAVERYYLESATPLLHGEAIAVGIICECWLSQQKNYITEEKVQRIASTIRKRYTHLPNHLDNLPAIIDALSLDKKSEGGIPMFSLLAGIGNFKINEQVPKALIEDSLHYYNSLHNN